jgi:cytochrome b involved in lipid metabolism
MAMKDDHMYMTLEQSKHNIKTHHSAPKDYTQTMKNK